MIRSFKRITLAAVQRTDYREKEEAVTTWKAVPTVQEKIMMVHTMVMVVVVVMKIVKSSQILYILLKIEPEGFTDGLTDGYHLTRKGTLK